MDEYYIYVPIVSLDTEGKTIEQIIEETQQRAEYTSMKLWELARPLNKRQANDSLYYCHWVTHYEAANRISNGLPFVVLALPRQDTVPVDVDANSGIIDELLLPFITLGYVTTQEVEALKLAVETSKGQMVNLYDFFPAFWKSLAIDNIDDWFAPRNY